MISVALYQPDIPQNLGAIMRLCACMGSPLHVIEPCSFPWDAKKMQRSGMDYIEHVQVERHSDWGTFVKNHGEKRIVLMTTKAERPYTEFEFQDGDVLLAGSESTGVPEDVHAAVDARVTIPMQHGLRSLNIATASAMILGEAIRQIGE